MSHEPIPNVVAPRTRPMWRFITLFGPTAIFVGGCFALFVIPHMHRTAAIGRMKECQRHLKVISTAFRAYSDEYGSYPPAFTVNDKGERLHSWRTLILPYIGEESLYRQIDLAQPWDAPVNRQARETAVSTYRCPSASGPTNHTDYLAIVSPRSLLRSEVPVPRSAVTAVPNDVVFALDLNSRHGVPWMEPRDLDEAAYLGLKTDDGKSHSGLNGYPVFYAASSGLHQGDFSSEMTSDDRLKAIDISAPSDPASGSGVSAPSP
jgi:hypothetical protein